jgi:hypothetical protein
MIKHFDLLKNTLPRQYSCCVIVAYIILSISLAESWSFKIDRVLPFAPLARLTSSSLKSFLRFKTRSVHFVVIQKHELYVCFRHVIDIHVSSKNKCLQSEPSIF